MNEFIEKLIERLEERRNLHAELSNNNRLTDDEKIIQERLAGCFQRTIGIVKDLAAEYNDGWIPCSERLPNKEEYRECNGQFVVSDGNRCYATYFDIYDTLKFGEPTIEGFRIDKCVIAWRPLPNPYREKGEKE